MSAVGGRENGLEANCAEVGDGRHGSVLGAGFASPRDVQAAVHHSASDPIYISRLSKKRLLRRRLKP
jgi:hypothetical protein